MPLVHQLAPNGINTIVVSTTVVVPIPDAVGGAQYLPEPNPAVRIDLPDVPDDAVCVGVDGNVVDPADMVIDGHLVFFAVAPLASRIASGRVSYLSNGEHRVHRFSLTRCNALADVMDSLQLQFDNVSEFVELSAQRHEARGPQERRAFLGEHAFSGQVRLLAAMELLPMEAAEYDIFTERSQSMRLTGLGGPGGQP